MASDKLDWAMPVMRMGYAGRGLTYLVVAGVSLWAIWRGGQAQGTSSAMQTLLGESGGVILLTLIACGLFAYCLWRVLDAAFDLEDYGSDAKATVSRLGMAITGLIHGALGVVILALIMGYSGDGGGGGIAEATAAVMGLPLGRFVVGFAGLCTVGAGVYYIKKALEESYREDLRANAVTVNANWVLKAGVAAQGVIVTILGVFLTWAGWTYDPSEAGGMESVFRFLAAQPMGNVLVVAICLGLLGFAVFCFVNAAYRIVPKLADEGIVTLAKRLGS